MLAWIVALIVGSCLVALILQTLDLVGVLGREVDADPETPELQAFRRRLTRAMDHHSPLKGIPK